MGFIVVMTCCNDVLASTGIMAGRDGVSADVNIECREAIDGEQPVSYLSALPDSDVVGNDNKEIVVVKQGEATLAVDAQDDKAIVLANDSILDSLAVQFNNADSVSAKLLKQTERWIPDPKRALWMAIVFPGGGQIYNRKYWKLPLIYGGFVGCVYALNWNNTMYRDYAQAYIDIMDDDDTTVSYNNFLPPNYDVASNLTRLQSLFKKKKDYYRRYRDISIFCFIAVYALSVVDAYVDAELSSFDISEDLTMRVKPSVIKQNSPSWSGARSLSGNSFGLQCSFAFR